MSLAVRRIPLVLAVVALVLVAPAPPARAGASAGTRVDAAEPVIVSFAPGASWSAQVQALAVASDANDGREGGSTGAVGELVVFASGAGFAAHLDAAAIAALRATPGVDAITPNRTMSVASAPHVERIGAPAVWADGRRGEGQTIVIVDTGVDTTNANLSGVVDAEVCFTPARGGGGDCPNGASSQSGPGAAAPCTGRSTDCSHGTHVASVAAGIGPAVVGVAPGARLLAARVFSSVVSPEDRVLTDEASLVRALEWVEDQLATRSIAAVNLSLGGAPVPTPCSASPALTAVLGRLGAAGVAVVASAGNDASASMVSFPACLPGVVAVAAEGAPGAPASFSNVAPKAALYAPGESIEGAWSDPCCTRTVSGTSFSAPQVSAAFALLQQAYGSGDVVRRVDLLRRTGDPVAGAGAGSYAGGSAIRLARALDPQYRAVAPAPLARPSSPIGVLDLFTTEPDALRVAGWALDPDNVPPVTVHVYVDGVLTTSTTASRARPDIAAVFAGYGATHGFDVRLRVSLGAHEVCAYALDIGPGNGNVLIGCRHAVLGAATGALDATARVGDVWRASGWAIDTGSRGAATVEVVVDGAVLAQRPALDDRPDVGAVAPAYGAAHGYVVEVSLPAGAREACVVARGVDAVAITLGCRALIAPPAA